MPGMLISVMTISGLRSSAICCAAFSPVASPLRTTPCFSHSSIFFRRLSIGRSSSTSMALSILSLLLLRPMRQPYRHRGEQAGNALHLQAVSRTIMEANALLDVVQADSAESKLILLG